MAAFVASFLFVLLAEMGDKTQLLAMAFAAKYSAHKVLIAVFIATLLNHGLAVLTGRFLTIVIPMEAISFIAALSFIIFGLWTLRGDKLESEGRKGSRFGPIVTVAIAFFLAEMGDKTQLATVSLAVKYQNMFGVLMGTTLAMVTADAIGIVVGIIMRKHIPQTLVKWVSAIVFILFGLSGIHKVLLTRMIPMYLWGVISLISISTICVALYLVRSNKKSVLD